MTQTIFRVSAIWSALLLGACDQAPRTGPDGAAFERREFDRPATLVTKVEYDTPAQLQRAATALGVTLEPAGGLDRTVQAFGFVQRGAASCTIHFVKPEHSPGVRLWMGHELAHCFYGRWHS